MAVVLAAVLAAAAALPTTARAEGIPYLLRIGGIEDDALRKMLQGVSRLKRLEGSPVASMGALRRRTQRDLEQFSRVLHAEGYYDHAIEYRIDTSREPLRVRVSIDTGMPRVMQRSQVSKSLILSNICWPLTCRGL